MRISDWSSDVCSSDLLARVFHDARTSTVDADAAKTLSGAALRRALAGKTLLYNTVYGEPCMIRVGRSGELVGTAGYANEDPDRDRKGGGEGKSVSVRVGLVGRRNLKKNTE